MNNDISTWDEFEAGFWKSIHEQGFSIDDFTMDLIYDDFMMIAKVHNRCIDCNKFQRPELTYVVKDEIWKKYVGKYFSGMLCKGCLSKRMGRKLIDEDYRENNGKLMK